MAYRFGETSMIDPEPPEDDELEHMQIVRQMPTKAIEDVIRQSRIEGEPVSPIYEAEIAHRKLIPDPFLGYRVY